MSDWSSEFYDPSFSMIDWINRELNAGNLLDPSDQSANEKISSEVDLRISKMTARLRELKSSVNANLELRMIDMFEALPGTIGEIERVDKAVRVLGNDVAALRGSLDAIHMGTKPELDILSRLDLTKNNMKSSVATIREAANWESLVHEVDTKFSADDVAGVVDSWENMLISIKVLSNMPGESDRERIKANVQLRLESALKLKLQAVLQEASLQEQHIMIIMDYADLYKRIGKVSIVREEYVHSRPAAIHKYWFSQSNKTEFLSWLPQALVRIERMISEDKRHSMQLFGEMDSPQVLCNLIVSTFEPITTLYAQSLQKYIEWPDVVESFSKVLLPFLVSSLKQASGSSVESYLTVIVHVTAPYHPQMEAFYLNETQYTKKRLNSLINDLEAPLTDLPSEMLMEPESAFAPRVDEILHLYKSIFDLATGGAVERCMSYTYGYQLPSLIKSIDTSLNLAFAACSTAAKRIRTLCGILCTPSQAVPNVPLNWAFLQSGLQILHASGRILFEFEIYEKQLAQKCTQATTELLYLEPVSGHDFAQFCSVNMVRRELARARLGGVWGSDGAKLAVEILRKMSEAYGGLGDLLKEAAQGVCSLVEVAQELIFDLCFSEVSTGLIAAGKYFEDVEYIDLPMENKHVLPQSYVTKVGEYLLSVWQQIEIFANGDGSESMLKASETVRRLATTSWQPLIDILNLSPAQIEAISLLASGRGLKSFLIEVQQGDRSDFESDEEDAVEHDEKLNVITKNTQKICILWLNTISTAAFGMYVSNLCKERIHAERNDVIWKQMRADIAYFMNVWDALDLIHHPLLIHIHTMLHGSRSEALELLKKRDSLLESSSNDPIILLLKSIEERVLR